MSSPKPISMPSRYWPASSGLLRTAPSGSNASAAGWIPSPERKKRLATKGTKSTKKTVFFVLFVPVVANLFFLSGEGIQPAALAFEPLGAVLSKPLDAGQYRLGIEMGFGDDIRFETAAEPLIVPIGCQR